MAERIGSKPLFQDIFAGLISGLMTVIASISYATLVFSGPASGFLSLGIVSGLVSATIIGLFVSFRSSSPIAVAGPDANISAILALISSSIVAAAAAAGKNAPVFTLLWIMLALSSFLTGIFLFMIGRFKLGRIIRFIPYPVIGGFLAGTGWLLVRGSFKVMCGVPLTFASLSKLADPAVFIHWLPGTLFGLVLLFVLRRFRHFIVMPSVLVGAILLFHVYLKIAGFPLSEAMARGWLLSPFSGDLFLGTFRSLSLAGLNPAFLTGSLGDIAGLMLIAGMVILLNAASVELTTGRDIDLDRELSTTGIANILAAPFGGMTGCMALSRTILNFKAGATGRLAGIVSALLCGGFLIFGARGLSLFPTPVLGGLLFYLGLSLLAEWVYDGWKKFSRLDFLLIVFIIVVIATRGFLPGVVAGLIIACILFAVNYARTGAIRRTLTGSGFRSNVERSFAEQDLLEKEGGRIQIVQLQGFLFFGMTYPFLTWVREKIAREGPARIGFFILDFSAVTGLDSSSLLGMSKLLKFCEEKSVSLVPCGAKPAVGDLLRKEGCVPSAGLFADLDRGLGWCEDRLLAEKDCPAGSSDFRELFSPLFDKPEFTGRFLERLERLEVKTGYVLFEEKSASSDLYFVESGGVSALSGSGGQSEGRRLGAMGPGAVIGEMGFYLGSTRTATVRAEKDSVLYRLTLGAMKKIELEDPELANGLHRFFVRLLSRRLIHANEELSLMEK